MNSAERGKKTITFIFSKYFHFQVFCYQVKKARRGKISGGDERDAPFPIGSSPRKREGGITRGNVF